MKTILTFVKNILPKMMGVGFLFLGLSNLQTTHGQYWSVGFDGAPALKPAQFEISLYGAGAYSSSTFGEGTVGYTPGIRAGIGIVKNFDVRLAYSRGFFKIDKLEDSRMNNICIAPKVSFLKEHLAFQLPFTFILYKPYYVEEAKMETYYLLTPRLIFTLNYKQYVQFNLSPYFEAFIPGDDVDPSYFVGGNIGFAFSSNLQRWSVRPEGFISYLFPKGENYKFINYGWGLAFTFNIDFKKENQ